ncbi:MAG: RrF2 family transcriptional regulator [Eubacterium sp.]|nr:RrF2 family transcriptional regulator [Eubacterium sp.]
MMISTKGRYALRVMIDLAQNGGEQYISLKDVANRQEISMKYLEMIVSLLHKGGMVSSLRGKSGGYKLTKKPEEYTLGAILKLTEGSLAPVFCLENGEQCDRAENCITLPLWKKLDQMIDDCLEQYTLQDLIDGKIQ